jgi:putative transposase
MFSLFVSVLTTLCSFLQTRAALQFEILALRQINVLRRSQHGRVRLTALDPFLWSWLVQLWSGWRSALIIVKPETVIGWHRQGFRLYWRWKSRGAKPWRPTIHQQVRELIGKLSVANPLWGAPRIHGELLKLGIDVSQATVGKYMVRQPRPPSQTWRTFLHQHLKDLVSTDFFVVPTVNFRILFVFVVLAHHRCQVIHFNVTAHPTSEWTAQQMVEAFPWDTAPPYLLHDRDSIYQGSFRQRVQGMGVREVLTAARSPWQNPHAERLIGSIRREYLDHTIVLNEPSLRRTLKSYFAYYNDASYCPTFLYG